MEPFDIIFQLPFELKEIIYKEWLQEYYISGDLVTSIKNMIVNKYYFKKMNVKFISNEELNMDLRKQILLSKYFTIKPVHQLFWDKGLHLKWEYGQKGLRCDYYAAIFRSYDILVFFAIVSLTLLCIGQYQIFFLTSCFFLFIIKNVGMLVTIKKKKRNPRELYHVFNKKIF